MWLTLLWQNKGLVALVALLAAFAALAGALKVQSMRLGSAKAALAATETARDEAIAAHDALVNDYAKQQALLAKREAVAEQQEKDHVNLLTTLDRILRDHSAWRGAAVPSDVNRMLQALPTVPTSGAAPEPIGPQAPASVPGDDQRRPAQVGLGVAGERS